MEIILENISKKYGSQWIFRNIDFHFEAKTKYALIGHNGAGKSTLLDILMGKIPYTKGKISYQVNGNIVGIDSIYKHLSVATTSMSLIEEFTLEEILQFHFRFRNIVKGLNQEDVLDLMELGKEKKKFISNFSSGMKQRLKIGLALFTDSSLLIFDEPGANLDLKSKQWFQTLLAKYLNDRTLLIASNDAEDYQICDHIMDIEDFKLVG